MNITNKFYNDDPLELWSVNKLDGDNPWSEW